MWFVVRKFRYVCDENNLLGAGMVLSDQDELMHSLQTDVAEWEYFPDSLSLDVKNGNQGEGITVFPNPNNGSFVLNFGNNNYNDFRLAVVNSHGQIIYSDIEIKANNYVVDLNEQPSGTYIRYLLNKKEESIISHRVIIQ